MRSRSSVGRLIASAAPALLLLAASCAPAQSGGGGRAAESAPPSAAPKVVTMALGTEPTSFGAIGATEPPIGQHSNVLRIVQDDLMSRTEGGGTEPRLASEAPSTDRGTWRINPDGTMDTTFKLRPGISWHDGAPFTSADALFAFTVMSDKDLVPKRLGSGRGRPDLMESATAPDPLTFVVHWSQVYVRADDGDSLGALPMHLLFDGYLQDKEAMGRSAYFFDDFVGLGAFRLEKWERGSHMEFSRFDGYYLGRPALDRVIVRFVPDSNTLIANILSGAVDVVVPEEGDTDAAFEVRRQWEGTGNQVRFDVLTGLEQIQIQHQPQYSCPLNGFTNVNVRQALYRAIDRQALADVMTQGVSPPADSWFAPNEPLRKDVESSIPQFPYDPTAATRQLEQQGWVRGADGVLTNRASGDRFETEMTVRPGASPAREGQVIADQWKSVGAIVQVKQLTPAMAAGEPFATQPGPSLISPSGYNFYDRRLWSKGIPTADNRWTGNNRGGYINLKVDDLLDKLAVTIDATERVSLHRQLLMEQMGDIALMPLFWQVSPILMLKGISGPRIQGSEATNNIYQWDKS
jgi:peptide/nickel transport system substrate-binding protein